MAQTRSTFSELHDNTDRAVFTLLGKEWRERKVIWKQIYDVKPSKKRSEVMMTVMGVGDIPEKGEGAAFTTDIIRKAYDREVRSEADLRRQAQQETVRSDDDRDGRWGHP